jgi:hypothetical protein
VLSVIGGALMIGAFFLPERLLPSTVASEPASSSQMVSSMWDVVYRIGAGTSTYVPRNNAYVSSQPFILTAILAGLPLIMGTLIVVLGIWSVLRRSGALRAGFFGAAVVLAMIGAAGNALFNNADIITSFYSGPTTVMVPNEAWLGFGSVVLLLGLFLVTAAGLASALKRVA